MMDENSNRDKARILARNFQNSAELANQLGLIELTKILKAMEVQILRQIVDGEFE